ncbi:MAG: histidine--tRNA ligase [Myxococcales bacterium]|nr:MAG: histidine--tRNA ligase [Myxococcales bacterium]
MKLVACEAVAQRLEGGRMSTLQAVKGMNDILPSEIAKWQRFETTFRDIAARYAFSEIRTPIVEPTELFARSIGQGTDIVQKEMYTFVDKGEKSLTLRPEGTASTARAFMQHRLGAQSPVNKLFYLGPMYRRERPAKGRYRQFFQAGAEWIGDDSAYADAETVAFAHSLLDALGIKEHRILINSIGSNETRANYRKALYDFLEPKTAQLSVDSQRRLELNPLRILDSKDPKDKALIGDAPSILDFLGADDREHFQQVQEALTQLGIAFEIETRLVRGLDYYNRSLFEIHATAADLGSQSAVLGGGRYDGLLETLGGKAAPATGFATGIERMLLAMPNAETAPQIDVAVLVAEASLRGDALLLTERLRRAGMRVDADWRGLSLKSQLRRSDKLGAPFAVILGQREKENGVVQLKSLKKHEQKDVGIEGLIPYLQSELESL